MVAVGGHDPIPPHLADGDFRLDVTRLLRAEFAARPWIQPGNAGADALRLGRRNPQFPGDSDRGTVAQGNESQSNGEWFLRIPQDFHESRISA